MQPNHEFDVIVVGLGATGGATLYHPARRGVRVLGLDRFTPPHEFGSSHGHTRIYRQAYYEAPAYVPLALRALELWHELERDTQQTLLGATVRLGATRRAFIIRGSLAIRMTRAIPSTWLSANGCGRPSRGTCPTVRVRRDRAAIAITRRRPTFILPSDPCPSRPTSFSAPRVRGMASSSRRRLESRSPTSRRDERRRCRWTSSTWRA